MIWQRLGQLLRDRQHRMNMSDLHYWNQRAATREGDARGAWHSATFNELLTDRQVEALHRTFDTHLGDITGKNLLEVGCCTGRITRRIAALGANLVGIDFSDVAIDAANASLSADVDSPGASGSDANRPTGSLRFAVADITDPPLAFASGTFDAVLAVGVLVVACRGLDTLEVALGEMARVVRPDGLVVLLEPIHTGPLLGRVLRATVGEWVLAAGRAGLRFVDRSQMSFVPARMALASWDVPRAVAEPVFKAGEKALDLWDPKQRRGWGDYTMLTFRAGR